MPHYIFVNGGKDEPERKGRQPQEEDRDRGRLGEELGQDIQEEKEVLILNPADFPYIPA
jgi:hypothetical protein